MVLIAGAILALSGGAWADSPKDSTAKTPCCPRCGYKVPITCLQSSDGLFAADDARLAGHCKRACAPSGGQCGRSGAGCSGKSGMCAQGGAACLRARDCSCRQQPCPHAEFPCAHPCEGVNGACAKRGHPEIGCPACAKCALVVHPLRDGSVGLKIALHGGAQSCLALVLYGKDGAPTTHAEVLSATVEGPQGKTAVTLDQTGNTWHGSFDVPAGVEYNVIVHTRMLGGAMETAVFPLAMSRITHNTCEAGGKRCDGQCSGCSK